MAGDLLIFLSKRLQRAAAALLCLMAAQLLLGLIGGRAEPAPGAVRVAISR